MERISSFYSLEHLVSTLDEQGVPEEFICPITQDFMRDPCIAEDGHTYERAAIEEWLGRHGTSPITRDYISVERLMPDPTLRQMIDDFLSEKRQLLLAQREHEKRLAAASGISVDEPRPHESRSISSIHADEEEDDDDDDDVLGHPYMAGGPSAERAPLMGLSADRDSGRVPSAQARNKPRPSAHLPPLATAHHIRPNKKGMHSSRSTHSGAQPFAPASGDRRRISSPSPSSSSSSSPSTTSSPSCWMCVLY